MPFLHTVMGYNIFDSSEVIPEFTADTAGRKNEKVDYVIVKNNEVQILIECKKHNEKLSLTHAGQLCRYFSTIKSARIGILTNGIIYEFYTDLDATHIMDEKPFLVLDITAIDRTLIKEVEKLSKNAFDLESIIDAAEELKYLNQIKSCFKEQLTNPHEDFVKFFIAQVYQGRSSNKIKDQFTKITQRAITQFISESINNMLKNAMNTETFASSANTPEQTRIITTEEELDGFYTIKAILRNTIDVSRIKYRDAQNYCAIIIDDNITKRICRLYFNGAQKYIGIEENKKEIKHPINCANDIFPLSDYLITIASQYIK